MAREEITGGEFKKSPNLKLTEKAGLHVKGTLQKKVMSKQFPGQMSYLIKVEDTDARTVLYNPNTKTEEDVDIAEGDAVFVKGTTVLNARLGQVAEGDKIEIEYHGLGDAAKGRRAPHIFKVFKI